MPEACALIIPCYDEARRLDAPELLRLACARPGLSLVLVDDGSSDATPALLEEVRARQPDRIRVIRLDRNRGKGEAVRRGMREALAAGATVVGYADADLSTPVDELVRLAASADPGVADVLLGSRVRLLGTDIERRPYRHYLGRIFATFASLALQLPVYDTQCGAKLFRASPALAAALERPFRSRWIFDVELLSRLVDGAPGVEPISPRRFLEVPLRTWRDVGGSKLRAGAALGAGLQLLGLLVARRLRRGTAVRG